MEDSKRIYKFYGKPGEDFHLWAARTEAALEAKKMFAMIETDILSLGDITDELNGQVATARATIIQGLGDRLLRLCLSAKNDPYRMWLRLKDRYAVSNTATKVQLQAKLSRMSYKGQAMQDFVDAFEEIFNRLAAMDSDIAEDLQTIQEKLDWETATATLIQEYDDQFQRSGASSSVRKTDQGTALAANRGQFLRKMQSRKNFNQEKRKCFGCGRRGHLIRDCRARRNNLDRQVSSSENRLRFDNTDFGRAQQAQLLLAEEEEHDSKNDDKVSETLAETPDETCQQRSSKDTEVLQHYCYCCQSTTHTYEFCEVGSSDIESSMYWQHYDCDDDFAASALRGSSSNPRETFLLDSGASEHMVCSKDWLHNLGRIEPRGIMLGDGNKVYATHEGTLVLRTTLRNAGDQCERIITLRKVLFISKLRSNLISCSRLCEAGYKVNLGLSGRCNGLVDGIIQFEGRSVRGVYYINASPIPPSHERLACVAVSQQGQDGDDDEGSDSTQAMKLWHARLGHAHIGSIKKLYKSGAIRDMAMNRKQHYSTSVPCESCMRGKQTKQRLRTNKSHTTEKCATIHTEICGPMSVPSFSGCRYFVSFVDEATGYVKIVPIVCKSEVMAQFKLFQAWLERKHNCTVKRVHSDKGGEYVAMKEYLSSQGIEQTFAPPYSPNQNGMAERTNRTIVECTRSLLEHAYLPRKFWAQAVVHCAHVRNLFFSPRNQEQTSYELMTGRKPSVAYLRVFGCLGWYHVPKDLRRELDAKSELGIVIGCFENSQYKLWIPSRNVTVVENQFPARNWDESWSDSAPSLLDEGSEPPADSIRQSTVSVTNIVCQEEVEPLTSEQRESLTHYPEGSNPTSTPSDIDGNESDEEDEGGPRGGRYPLRKRQTPDFYSPGSSNVSPAFYGKSDPLTVHEALSRPDAAQWRAAIDSELQSLRKHHTWDEVQEPKHVKPLSTKFLSLRKIDENGNIVRHKARLVVRGFMQGDVHQTFAPVVDFAAVRTCLSIAVQRGFVIEQMDIRTAFLRGEISEDVCLTAPEGFALCEPQKLLKLRRGLYGLKQAPKLWNDKRNSVMKKMGFKALKSDACIYRVWLLIYVDDIIVMGAQRYELQTVKEELGKQVDVKDLGILHSFLGVLFMRDEEGAWLSQAHYTRQVQERFSMHNANSVSTPMVEGALRDVSDVESSSADRELCQELLGCLLFIATRTRPDICASVSILCRYPSNLSKLHMVHLKRVLRYLRGTVNFALRISRKCSDDLSAFCDADWAGDRVDRKSTTGILLQLGSTSIVWRTLKQGTVALSTTEAEFLSLSEGTKLIVWLRQILAELDCKQREHTVVWEDNQGAVLWGSEGVDAQNMCLYARTLSGNMSTLAQFASFTAQLSEWSLIF